MKYLWEENVQPKIEKSNYMVGSFEVDDGLIDITDPGYDKDDNCSITNQVVKAGRYIGFIDLVNFPLAAIAETPWEADHYHTTVGGKVLIDDKRIVSLTVVHEDFVDNNKNKRWLPYPKSVPVDAGMCGFYNHKPDFSTEEVWTKFWQNCKNLKGTNCTCDVKRYGITVSSGFGDGVYEIKVQKDNRKIIALKLLFT